MRKDELLIATFAGTRLRMELDRVPLWRGDHVEVRQFLDDFARYLYLPRLRDLSVLLEAIQTGLGLMTWEQDSFAYANSYDEDAGRYRALEHGPRGPLTESDPALGRTPRAWLGCAWVALPGSSPALRQGASLVALVGATHQYQ